MRARLEDPFPWPWPVRLPAVTPLGEEVVLRPLERADEREYLRARADNAAWLGPWDATSPVGARPRRYRDVLAEQAREARAGRSLPLVITTHGRIVGQINASGVTRGAFRSASVGYWVVRDVAGRWFTPTALAALGDHLFGTCGLHRLQVDIRPENAASLAVVGKLGFRDEGMRANYLHIDGAWRDHRSFALTTEDLAGETLRQRCQRAYRATAADTPEDLRSRPAEPA